MVGRRHANVIQSRFQRRGGHVVHPLSMLGRTGGRPAI
jgi:hypothetical protein